MKQIIKKGNKKKMVWEILNHIICVLFLFT